LKERLAKQAGSIDGRARSVNGGPGAVRERLAKQDGSTGGRARSAKWRAGGYLRRSRKEWLAKRDRRD